MPVPHNRRNHAGNAPTTAMMRKHRQFLNSLIDRVSVSSITQSCDCSQRGLSGGLTHRIDSDESLTSVSNKWNPSGCRQNVPKPIPFETAQAVDFDRLFS